MKTEQRFPWPVILAMLGIAAAFGAVATTALHCRSQCSRAARMARRVHASTVGNKFRNEGMVKYNRALLIYQTAHAPRPLANSPGGRDRGDALLGTRDE